MEIDNFGAHTTWGIPDQPELPVSNSKFQILNLLLVT